MIDRDTAIDVFKKFRDEILKHEQWYKNIVGYLDAVLLYGSVAKGTNRPDSDIDIMMILPLKIEEEFTEGEYFYKYNDTEINIVLRSIERLRDIAQAQQDTFQKEVFRELVIIDSDREVRELLDNISTIN